MIYKNGKISAGQLYKLSVTSFAGISCLLTAQIGVVVGGQNGLLCVMGATLLAVLYTAGILALCEKVQWDYEEYARRHFHRIINGLLYVFFGLRYAGMLIGVLLVILQLTKSELLAEISYPALLIPVLLMVFYSVSKKIEARARLAECLFSLLLLSLLLPILMGFSTMKISYVLPAFSTDVQTAVNADTIASQGMTIAVGCMLLWLLFSPSEMLLFSSSFFSASHNTKKAAIRGVFTVGLLNIFYYLVIVGNLSTALGDRQKLLAVRFAQTVKLPYLMFEKQGIFFVLFLLVSIFLSAFSLAYHSTALFSMAGKAFSKSGRTDRMKDFDGKSAGAMKSKGEKAAKSVENISEKPAKNSRTVSISSRICLLILTVAGVTAGAHCLPMFGSILAPADVRIQIEHRQYADCMIMDYDPQTEEFQVYFSIGEKNGSSGYWYYKTKNLSKLRTIYTDSSNKRLDLSHVEVVLLQEQMVRDAKILDRVVAYIDREKELSDNLNICVTRQQAETFVEKAAAFTAAPGLYIGQLIENNRKEAGTRFLTLLLVQKGIKRQCVLSCFEAGEGNIAYLGSLSVRLK